MYTYHNWLCLILLSLSALLALTSAAILPRLDQSNVIFPLEASNSTPSQSSSFGVDPHFRINPIFDGPSLDQDSLLMSSVQLLAREALLDINGQVQRVFWHSPDSRYSSVGVYVLPPSRAATINRRYLVWGLAESLQLLMKRNRFASVKLSMTMERVDVGSVEFTLLSNEQQQFDADKSASRLERPVNSSILATDSISADIVAASTKHGNNTLSTNAVHLQVFCRLFGYDLEASEVFGPVVTTLSRFAAYSPGAHMRNWKTPFEIGETALEFKSTNRRSPPFFEVEWLIKATAAVPLYMLNKGRFSEVEIQIAIDNTAVAVGQLRIERTPHGPHFLNNISIY